ncbi:hypothetical protein KSP40_PGU015785 [Platanthera guangdongensis]|uniref:Uncharacterized protein n=1 Tax=Platanthera guangdongensis TaxID=2320717 RepID=A0ABR2MW22_9ASPA
MASESSVTDQSISELTGVKELGDDTKEEEKHEPEDVSVADEFNKEEEHKQVSSSSESALDANEGKPNDVVEIFTSKEPVNSVFKQEDLKPAEVAPTSENEIDPVSSNDKAEIELVESEDSKDDVHELMHTKVPIVIFPDASEVPEEIDVDRSTLTCINVPVKNLEAESGSPEEHKSEESAETKPNLELIKSISAVDSEAPEENNADSITPTAIEVPLKDPESSSVSHEEKKLEEHGETKQHVELSRSEDCKEEVHELVPTEVSINSEVSEKIDVDSSARPIVEVLVKDFEVVSSSPEEQKAEVGAESEFMELIKSGYSKEEGQELVSEEVPTGISEAAKKNNVHLSVPTSAEVPLKHLEVESGSPEEQELEVGVETKVDIELIESGESKDEGQDLVSGEVPTNTSEAQKENDVDSSIPTSTVVPVKDLEVESGSPEEQKPEEGAETKVNIKLIESGDSKVEGQESVSAEVPASTSEEREDNNTDLSIPTVIEVPVKDLEVESGYPEEQKIEESTETKVNTDFIESGESKDEGQASCKVPTGSSQASEINDVDLSIPTSTEVPVKDLEVESGSPEEQKPKEGAETKVNIKLIEPGDSKVEGQESVSAEVSASTSEESENNNTDLSTPTSIEVPVKDIEVESGSPEEQKIEESAETKVNTDFIESGESKDEGQASGEVSTGSSQAPEINDVHLSIPTSTEVPVKDLGVESGSPEEQKPEEGAETKVNIKLIESGDSKVEGQESVSAEVPASPSEECQENNADLSTPTVIEVPLKDLEIKSGFPEEQKLEEIAKTNVEIESLKLGDSKDEGQESVDLTSPTSTKVPVNDLEVEFGSAEEQNPKESVETKEPSSDVTTIDGGGEVAEPSSYEDRSSGAGEVVDKEDEGLKEEVIYTRIEEDQTPDEDKVSEAVVVKKDDEFVEYGIEGSTVLDVVPPVTEVFPDELLEESKEETSEVDNADSAPKVSEVSLAGGNVLEDANVEAIEKKNLAETSIDSTAGGVSTGQAKIPENVEVEPLELKFENLVVSPETSEVSSVGERVSAVDEKSETSKGEERKDETSEVDNTDTERNVSEVSSAVGNVLEKNVNVEAIERDLYETSIDCTTGSFSTEQAKIRKDVEVEPLELKFEELNVSPEASEVPSFGERFSTRDENSESSKGGEMKDETSEADNTDSAPKMSEVSSAVGNVLEKDVNVKAIERDLAETGIDSTVDRVSTEQAKNSENVEVKPLALKFEEFNPKASQVPSVGERVSACDEKSESSKGEIGVTLVETPSLAHFVEEMENESSKSEKEASVEQFPEAVKEIIASESYNVKKDETPRDVSLEEKNMNVTRDKKSEVKVEGVIENAPEHEELGIKKREDEKPKDEEPILSSDTRDVKLIKERTKRDSNIFTKVKRSIIKAKKAILGKSPGPKTVSSESKDENI